MGGLSSSEDSVACTISDLGLRRKRKEPWSTHLLNHIEGELQALALKHGKQVPQEDREVLMAVPEGDEDSHLQEMAGKGAISRLLAPAYQLHCYKVVYPWMCNPWGTLRGSSSCPRHPLTLTCAGKATLKLPDLVQTAGLGVPQTHGDPAPKSPQRCANTKAQSSPMLYTAYSILHLGALLPRH